MPTILSAVSEANRARNLLRDIALRQVEVMTIFTPSKGLIAASNCSRQSTSKREGSDVRRLSTPSKSRNM